MKRVNRSKRTASRTPVTRCLGVDFLEDRRTLSAWNVQVLDAQNLIPAQVEDQMRAAGNYVMQNFDRLISWKGTLDVLINVVPPHPEYDGYTPSIIQVMRDGRSGTIYEMQTGIDPMPNNPDAGMTVFMGRDGTVKVYGMKMYFDPDPAPYVPANVPAGFIDFIGVLTHEVGHSLAICGSSEFNRYVTVDNVGYRFFNGPETVRLLGRPLPLTTMGSSHYGNYKLADNPIRSGLMYEWGNYGGNRLDVGKLDLAIFRDVGITVKNEQGLPLVDTMDSQMPRVVLNKYTVQENMAAGTFVANFGTPRGVNNYTFQILPVMDGSSFRLSGNTLVTTTSFDYELKSVYTFYVRTIDRDGVWTDSKLSISVLDVFENPVLQLPASASFRGDVASLGYVRIGGNNETKVSVVFYCASGFLGYSGRDPDVQVYSVRNNRGGTTMILVGTTAALNRNFRNVYYIGKDDRISAQIAANGRNWGGGDIRLVRA